ncbi:MAG: AAA-associated domain-containing protein [Thermoplasmata archaeon]|nr:AAA-associated domain-containing protein [Thermoplasmata archaeon]MCI4360016.1 AAA-associated domain-containing protein [Thermoplasmata archaeon]
MPTVFPKCSPTEMLGLLVLLESHKGDQEIARLADDLDLEIDEILPAIDFAQVLGFVKVSDGRAVLTSAGKGLMAGSINARRAVIREQLVRTTLFKALSRALESSPEHRLTEEEVIRLISFTTAPADELVQNIINWGRYAGMFRYDPDQHLLLPARASGSRTSSSSRRPPPVGPTGTEKRSEESPSKSSILQGSEELASFVSMTS